MPPTSAPMLVPTMQSIGTRSSSSTDSTPTCAAPFAPPPPSARPMRGRTAVAVRPTQASRAPFRPRAAAASANRPQRRTQEPLARLLAARPSWTRRLDSTASRHAVVRPVRVRILAAPRARAIGYSHRRMRTKPARPPIRPGSDFTLSRRERPRLLARANRPGRHALVREGRQGPRAGRSQEMRQGARRTCRTSSTRRTGGRCC